MVEFWACSRFGDNRCPWRRTRCISRATLPNQQLFSRFNGIVARDLAERRRQIHVSDAGYFSLEWTLCGTDLYRKKFQALGPCDHPAGYYFALDKHVINGECRRIRFLSSDLCFGKRYPVFSRGAGKSVNAPNRSRSAGQSFPKCSASIVAPTKRDSPPQCMPTIRC